MKFELKKEMVLINSLVILFSVISGGLGLMFWFLFSDVFMEFISSLAINKWKLPAIHHFTFLTLGISWLIFVLLIHYFYNKNKDIRRLVNKFFLVTSIQLFSFFICQVVMITMNYINLAGNVLVMGTELIV